MADPELHTAIWAWPDGATMLAVVVPFRKSFFERLKVEVPVDGRMWVREARMWVVGLGHERAVRDLISVAFPDEEVCSCWFGKPCAMWDRLHYEMIGKHCGGLAARRTETGRPSASTPPRPMQRPDPQAEARRILGVAAGAPPEVIKAAAKALAFKFHPDRPGGSNEAMAQINAARDLLLGARPAHRAGT